LTRTSSPPRRASTPSLIIIVTARDEAAAKPRFLRPPYGDEAYDTDGSAQQPVSGRCGRLYLEVPMYRYTGRRMARRTITRGAARGQQCEARLITARRAVLFAISSLSGRPLHSAEQALCEYLLGVKLMLAIEGGPARRTRQSSLAMGTLFSSACPAASGSWAGAVRWAGLRLGGVLCC
jgi:hypothetical protein